ncbi:MAG: AMIN domain-containing protein [Synechococcales cyanobacterium CRU_2_2]|nr:AMIN domain-containing protein [Synechococcales cyanobacterium CRU_2_2]
MNWQNMVLGAIGFAKLRRIAPLLAAPILFYASAAEAAKLNAWRFNPSTNQLEFTTDSAVQPKATLIFNPYRLVIDLPGTTLSQPTVRQDFTAGVKQLRIAQFDKGATRVVLELNPGFVIDPNKVQIKKQGSSNTWIVDLTPIVELPKPGTTQVAIQVEKAAAAAIAPAGPWMYPEDQLSDISDRLMAAEVTREKVFKRLHDELPYESTVETTAWTRTKKNELKVEQTIYVSREGHRPIVLGKGGQTLKAIGEAARTEMTALFGETVHLFLTVNVREGWAEEKARYREMGLDIVD